MKERPVIIKEPTQILSILAGHKTHHRVPFKDQPVGDDLRICETAYDWEFCADGFLHGLTAGDHGYEKLSYRSPHGISGDRLWVREEWASHWDLAPKGSPEGYKTVSYPNIPKKIRQRDGSFYYTNPYDSLTVWYKSSVDHNYWEWKNPNSMPRWASRITLEITKVWIDRLQNISEEEIKSEGILAKCISISQSDFFPLYWDYNKKSPECLNNVDSYSSLWDSINGENSWSTNPWVWVYEFRRIEP